MQGLEDTQLASRAREGDLDAFDELVRRHQHAAKRVALVVAGADRADDAAQDGFLRAFRSLDGFDPARPFRPWLLHIVANSARSQIRSEQRHLGLQRRAQSVPALPVGDTADTAVANDEITRVFAALERLGPDDRLVLALRWFEQMSEREMAEVLNVAAGTVKSRLARAMGRLRGLLEEDDDG